MSDANSGQRGFGEIDDKELAEIFLKHAIPAAEASVWAIPPELMSVFINHHGYYPFFCAVKETLKEYLERHNAKIETERDE